MSQVLQVLGALLLLSGFIAAQAGVLKDTSASYLVANALGGTLLATLAYIDKDYGFLLLEGTWAVVSSISLFRAHPARSGVPAETNADPVPGFPRTTEARLPLPGSRTVRFGGDELSTEQRLIRFFRNSYAGAQGRQWLQPHVLWWTLTFLRDNDVQIDFDTLTATALRARTTTMPLPAGHSTVQPGDQTELNFALWWSIFLDIAEVVFRPRRRLRRRGGNTGLPRLAELHSRAWQLGLRPWMSSATLEELSGIARALAIIEEHESSGTTDSDRIMAEVLLPELLLAELHWLHTPGGRTRSANRPRVDVVLLRRYSKAQSRWADDRYLEPLDHMYLRAGDILTYLSRLPEAARTTAVQSVMSMYEEVAYADAQSAASLSGEQSSSVTVVTGPPGSKATSLT
ncbi:CBU_0592 family membrane protein [Nocardia brasiliensis]|uniref:CBU_0592 family membrane protein n=1 Tax=Nocardia brasiliensis TaxID=37326 RepID=UPI0024582CA7|nr:hypothetical protein [Nocardia brasiliensis]